MPARHPFQDHTPLLDAKELPLGKDARVLSDRIGFLPKRQAKSRKNPMQAAVREIVVATDRAKRLRILTNDLDAPAGEIAALYKRRWQIELFFRLLKQTLKIRHFIGRSQNAVRIQIAFTGDAEVAPISRVGGNISRTAEFVGMVRWSCTAS